MGDGPQRLEYERAEGRPAVGRIAVAAIGVSAAFVASSFLLMVPDMHDRSKPAVAWPWVATGLMAGTMVLLVRGRVKRGRWQEARAGRWSVVLLTLGLVLGGFGMATGSMRRRWRDVSPVLKCSSNIMQIGSAITLYSAENGGRYPVRLEQLLLTEEISTEVFVCPQTSDQPARGPTTQALVDGLSSGGHLSYVYLGAGLTSRCDPDTVVLYESPSNHGGAMMNVLFGDGRVDRIYAAQAREIMDRVAAGERPVIWKGPGVRAGPTTRGG